MTARLAPLPHARACFEPALRIHVPWRIAVSHIAPHRDSLFRRCYFPVPAPPLWAKLLIALAIYKSLHIAPPPLQGFTEWTWDGVQPPFPETRGKLRSHGE